MGSRFKWALQRRQIRLAVAALSRRLLANRARRSAFRGSPDCHSRRRDRSPQAGVTDFARDRNDVIGALAEPIAPPTPSPTSTSKKIAAVRRACSSPARAL